MARDQVTIECPPGAWTQLTNANATAVTFQVVQGVAMIRFTAGETAPSSATDDGIIYAEREGATNTNIADLVALSGANRVWARPLVGSAKVYIDHA